MIMYSYRTDTAVTGGENEGFVSQTQQQKVYSPQYLNKSRLNAFLGTA